MTKYLRPAVEAGDDNFVASPFFVFRTPLLPFDEMQFVGSGTQGQFQMAAQNCEESFVHRLTQERSNLKGLLERPEVSEAIFVANQQFPRFLKAWQCDPNSKKGRKAEVTIVRYLSRMMGRATPFGLFAGFSCGKIGATTCLHMLGLERYRRFTALSFERASQIADELHRNTQLGKHLRYRLNSSLYRVFRHIRYVERNTDNDNSTYRLISVRASAGLRRVLQLARKGATSEELIRHLVSNGNSRPSASEFVERLIQSQILEPEVAVSLTGKQAVHHLIDRLPKTGRFESVRSSLRRITANLTAVDRLGLFAGRSSYQKSLRALASLTSEYSDGSPFCATLMKPAPDASLGQDVVAEIARGIRILHHLPQNDRPADFEQSPYFMAFVAKYGRREVALVEALDDDIGICEDLLPANSRLHEAKSQGPSFPKLVLQKFSEALLSGAHEMSLNERDLEILHSSRSLPLPESFVVKAAVAGSESGSIVGNFRVVLEGGLTSTGAGMFTRLCQFDSHLKRKVMEFIRMEEAQRADAVFAELVHLPSRKLGDLAFRPVLRKYEIPYLGKSGAPTARQLPITDLMLSVRHARFHLRSRVLNREVVIRTSNPHDFNTSQLSIYKFLCSIQHQGTAGRLWWEWGPLLGSSFLPRVISGRLILCLARWLIDSEEVGAFPKVPGARQFRIVQEWRQKRGIPRWVAVSGDDPNLPIDLDSALSVTSFVQWLKQKGEALIQELYPAPDHLIATGPEGKFVHDLLVAFTCAPRASRRPGVSVRGSDLRREVSSRDRIFPPLSEWIYVKLYAGTVTIDTLLRERIRLLVASSHRQRLIDRWFFLRYGDPESHLRLRCHLSAVECKERFLQVLKKEIDFVTTTSHVWRVQFDTYEREIERYGGHRGALLAEQIFHYDSQSVLDILSILNSSDDSLDDRWRIAVVGVDLLFQDFGYGLAEKQDLVEFARKKFAVPLVHTHGRAPRETPESRQAHKAMELLLGLDCLEKAGWNASVKHCLRVFRRRSSLLSPVIARLKALERRGQLSEAMCDLTLSFVHMHLNRLLRLEMNLGEDEVYDALGKFYKSSKARSVPGSVNATGESY